MKCLGNFKIIAIILYKCYWLIDHWIDILVQINVSLQSIGLFFFIVGKNQASCYISILCSHSQWLWIRILNYSFKACCVMCCNCLPWFFTVVSALTASQLFMYWGPVCVYDDHRTLFHMHSWERGPTIVRYVTASKHIWDCIYNPLSALARRLSWNEASHQSKRQKQGLSWCLYEFIQTAKSALITLTVFQFCCVKMVALISFLWHWDPWLLMVELCHEQQLWELRLEQAAPSSAPIGCFHKYTCLITYKAPPCWTERREPRGVCWVIIP